MKRTLFGFTAAALLATGSANASMIITGVIDGPLSGGTPKAVELYVTENIADLSEYGLDFANNGDAFDLTANYTFSGSASAGDYIYIASESPNFTSFFGFAPDDTGSVFINGNDAVGLLKNGVQIDTFGNPGDVTGSGDQDNPWGYLDSYAYRNDGTGPDGNSFVLANWTVPGNDTLDGTSNSAGLPFGTYVPEPGSLALLGLGGLLIARRRRR